MDILNNLNEQYEIVSSEPASSEEQIQQLIEFSEIKVPEEYINIIRQQTELSIRIRSCSYECYIYIESAAECINLNESYEIQKWIPDSLAIGTDEGLHLLIYATGSKGFGIYAVEYTFDMKNSIYLSDSLESLLIHADGIDITRKVLFGE